MELEKKVQILEQEIEILKNQIQATLLDIKEQLLTHTYPVLRADIQPSSSIQSVNEQHTKSAITETETSTATSDNPSIRKVSLSDIGKLPAVQYQPEIGIVQNSTTPALDGRTMQELEAWANNTLIEVGIQRTRELINLYTANGQFTPAMHDALLQMISIQPISRATMPSGLSSKSRPHTAPEQKKRPVNGRKQANKKDSVKQPGTIPQQNAAKRQRAPQPPNHRSKALDEDSNVEKNNVVLRLIAGIQNAGAGVKWKRKNG